MSQAQRIFDDTGPQEQDERTLNDILDSDECPDLGIDRDAEWHSWAITHRRHLLDEIRQARVGIENMPETRATFTASDVVDSIKPSHVPNELLELHGAWPIPDTLPSRETVCRVFVNPNYVHAKTYPEVITRCECGCVMVREESYLDREIVQAEHEHADDCPKYNRMYARARLAEKRAEVIERVLLHGHSVRSMRPRIGITTESIGPEAEGLCLDVGALKERGSRMMARTWVRFLPKYSCTEIAEAHGVHAETVRRRIRKYTDADMNEFAGFRRNND